MKRLQVVLLASTRELRVSLYRRQRLKEQQQEERMRAVGDFLDVHDNDRTSRAFRGIAAHYDPQTVVFTR